MLKLNHTSPKEYAKVPQTYQTYELNSVQRIHYLLLCGICLAAIALLFYHSWILSVMFAFLSIPGQKYYCEHLAEKRKNQLAEQFKDVLYSISASISAGRQIGEALKEAEQNMRIIYQEDSLIVNELTYMNRRLDASKESEEDILRDFAQRSMINDISNFVDIYFTCRVTGGDLVKVVMKASEIIMDKMVIEKEIHTLTAQKRFESKILTAIPILIILFLQLVSPDYLQIMYEDIRGKLLMTVALFSIGLSYLWSMKLTRIEV